ncbi:MAG: M15 family metallopeptidase [Treponema sp.]|nr:M15 family metallopeptidase [Treponema sp.]
MISKLKFVIVLFLFLPFLCQAQQVDRDSPQRAEQVMKALASAYPGIIDSVQFRDNDWAVSMRGVWYYYAGGKLLPGELMANAAEFDPQPFYNYPKEMPPWRAPSAEEAARIKNMAANRGKNPPKRSQYFFDELWRARSKDESYDRVKSIHFLGLSVLVHYSILENLSLVEEQILTAAKTDPELRAWIANIKSLEGWNWRPIADTRTRSFHAYGAAVDILMKSAGGKETYWMWAARSKPDWWNVPYSQRLNPPDTVIKAFESRGFVWGGKWLYFDTMHFEYRPEILILSGMPPDTSR